MKITELLQLTNMNLTPFTIFMHLLVTFLLSMIIYFVYKITYSGIAYSKSFNVSIVLTSVVIAMVMMVIGNNLALSLGMVGALSIVRFRSAVKEPKDISYIFWGIAVGLSAGTGAYPIAIMGTVMIALIIIGFNIKKGNDLAYLLVVRDKKIDSVKINEILERNTKRCKVRTRNITANQSEFMYEIYIKPNSEEIIINELQELDLELVNIIAYNNDIGR